MFFGSTYKLSIKLVKIGRKKTGNCELKALIIQQQKPWLPLPSLVEHFSLSTSSNRDLLKRICYFSSSFFSFIFFVFHLTSQNKGNMHVIKACHLWTLTWKSIHTPSGYFESTIYTHDDDNLYPLIYVQLTLCVAHIHSNVCLPKWYKFSTLSHM
jgi:hypothetical protein